MGQGIHNILTMQKTQNIHQNLDATKLFMQIKTRPVGT